MIISCYLCISLYILAFLLWITCYILLSFTFAEGAQLAPSPRSVMARKVLILGAAGQLGRRVCDKFLERQWHTFGADTRHVMFLCGNHALAGTGLPRKTITTSTPKLWLSSEYFIMALSQQKGDGFPICNILPSFINLGYRLLKSDLFKHVLQAIQCAVFGLYHRQFNFKATSKSCVSSSRFPSFVLLV